MKQVMSIHWKRSAVTTVIFAIAGFVIACLTFSSVPLVNWPGICCLSLYLRIMHESIWEKWEYLFIANAVIYGVIGCFIGAFTRTSRQTLYITGLFVIIILVGAFSWLCFREYERYVKHSRSINEWKRLVTNRLEVDPNDIYALYWVGVHHLTRTGQYLEAERCFKKVVDLELTQNVFSSMGQHSLIYLAIIYQSWGRYQEAENFYQGFIATKPDFNNDLALLNYNNDYLKAKQQQKK